MSLVQLNEPMSRHTSWRVGGAADIFFMPESIDELSSYLQELSPEMPVFFCGLGSNLLVRDGGIRGLVVSTQRFLNKIELLDGRVIRAETGVSCASLARFSARQNLTGIEFLAGVPGTVGGALAMNAGCHGGETWPHVDKVALINRQGQCFIREAKKFSFGYRHVDMLPEEWFIAAYFRLSVGEKSQSLETIRALLDYRTATQPTNVPSGGSTFRNPPGDFAARLIEASGLKGFKIGQAMVSPKHANFIVNCGDATALDIEQLILHVQKEVERKQGVKLMPEVKIVGEWS